jgi:hypothetical protein
LPSKNKALSSNSNIAKKKERKEKSRFLGGSRPLSDGNGKTRAATNR